MINALSIDLEDYFHVSAFERVISENDWPKFESRVDINCKKLLSILDKYNIKCTFFVLGWEAKRNPNLIKEIYKLGHEIASHGFRHKLVYNQTKEEFREDIKKTKSLLEDITGNSIKGYRAASYSITKRSFWALDILAEEGFVYDSSIFPIKHDRYGISNFFRFPQEIKLKNGLKIIEFPPSTIRILGQNIPIAGGGYLRILPFKFIMWGISYINYSEKKPCLIYLHPWEIDPNQPKIKSANFISSFRHYRNLDKTEKRLESLLKKFSFTKISDILSSIK